MGGSKQASTGLKRKASQNISRKASKRAKKRPQDRPFPFFDLPAELRNIIYGMVAEDATAYLKKGTLTDGSSMMLVNRQVQSEYVPILTLCVGKIKTEVRDFDFRHIVTFINRLSAAELDAMPQINQPNARTIIIALDFHSHHRNGYHSFPPDADLLRRWLNRAGHPTKKGTNLDFRYTVATARGFGPMGVEYNWPGYLARWRGLLENFLEVATDGRVIEEVEKIRSAFLRQSASIEAW